MPLAVLQGRGLTPGGLIESYGTLNASGNVTMANLNNMLVLADSTSGNLTVTLNLSANCPGAWVFVRRATNNANTVTVVSQGADTIDGTTSRTLPGTGGPYPGNQWYTIALLSSGTGWMDMFQYTSAAGRQSQPGQTFQISAQGAGAVPLTVLGAAGQTGDLLDFKNSSGTILAGYDASGQLYLGAAGSWGGGTGPMLFMGNDTADPSSNPTGGVILFSSAGVLKARTPNGTVTTIAPAPAGLSFPLTDTAPSNRVEYKTNVTGDTGGYRFAIDSSGALTWGDGQYSDATTNKTATALFWNPSDPVIGQTIQVNGSFMTGQGFYARAWSPSANALFVYAQGDTGTRFMMDASANQYWYADEGSQSIYWDADVALMHKAGAHGTQGLLVSSVTPNFTSGWPNLVPLTVQGASGQTADLLDIKSSSGTNLISIDAHGNMMIGTGLTGLASYNLQIGTATTGTLGVGSFSISEQSGQTKFYRASGFFDWEWGTGASTMFGGGLILYGAGAATSTAFQIQLGNPARVAFQAYGAGGQTADIFQVATYSGNGTFRVDNNLCLTIQPQVATAVPLTVQGASGQTADVLDIKLSGDTYPRFAFTSTRLGFSFGAQPPGATIGLGAPTLMYGNANTLVTMGSIQAGYEGNSGYGFYAIGFSPTDNLIAGAQYQNAGFNDAGNWRFEIDVSGGLYWWGQSTVAGSGVWGGLADVQLYHTPSVVHGTAGAGLILRTNWAAINVFTIQGAASQTGDLLEFKNSAGTVLTSFDSVGLYHGPASGDLSGTYPGPTVAKVNGVTLTGVPTANQVPVASSGTAAAWGAAPASPPNGAAGGDLSGTYPNPTVFRLNGTSLAGLATGLLKNTTATGVPSIAVAADIPTVAAGATGALSATDASTTNSRAPTGAATGDLSGTYPAPTVARINGTSVPATPTAGQVLTATSGTVATWQAPSGASFPLSNTAATTSTVEYQTRVTADTNYRFTMWADGSLLWGPGSTGNDTAIQRTAANVLAMPALNIATSGAATSSPSLQINMQANQGGQGILLSGSAAGITGNLVQVQGQSASGFYLGANCSLLLTTPAAVVSTLTTKLNVTPGATTDVPLTVTGIASQSADLFDIKNSGGTILAGVNSNGTLSQILAGAAAVAHQTQVTADTNPRFSITASGSHSWGSGAAAADITMNRSAGNQLAISGAGVFVQVSPAPTGTTGLTISNAAAAGSGLLLFIQAATGTTGSLIQATYNSVPVFTVAPTGATSVVVNAVTAVPLTVQGANSQSADLLDLVVGGLTLVGVNNVGTLAQNLAATATVAYQTKQTLDANPRFSIAVSGFMSWGPGNAVSDTSLGRSAAGSLALSATGANSPTLYFQTAAGQGSQLYFSKDGAQNWLFNQLTADNNLYIRDVTSARIHITLTPGATAATATTALNSNLTVAGATTSSGAVSVGGAPTFASGTGPMLFLQNDTADPTGSPTGGSILYANASYGLTLRAASGAARLRIIRSTNLDDAAISLGADALNGDSILHLYRGSGANEEMKLVAAAGGSTGQNNIYLIDRLASSGATARSLMFRTSIDSGTTWVNQMQISAQGYGAGSVVLFAPASGDFLRFMDSTGATLITAVNSTGGIYTGQSAAGNGIFTSYVAGGANPMYALNANGTMGWGPGGASGQDVTLARIGAGGLQIAATGTNNPTLYLLSAAGQGSQLYWTRNGVATWLQYQLTGDANFYFRDMVNARMHMIFIPGAGVNSAMTEIASNLQVDGNALVTNSAPATVPLTIQAAASQTADLMQVKNSGSTVLAGITSTGGLYAGSTSGVGGTWLALTAKTSADIPLRLYAAAGQTSPLLWTNVGMTINGDGSLNLGPASLSYNSGSSSVSFWYNGGTWSFGQAVSFNQASFVTSSATPAVAISSTAGTPFITCAAGGAGTYLTFDCTSPAVGQITSPLTELILQQTGDSLGTSKLHLQARSGITGALLETVMASTPIVDLGMIGTGLSKALFRLEGRSSNWVDTTNTQAEFQWMTQSSTIQMWAGNNAAGVIGRFIVGGGGTSGSATALFNGGSGPMLYLGNDTADPTGYPTNGVLLYSSAGVLKARDPSGQITQLVPGFRTNYVQTLSAPTVASSPYTVNHNLQTTNVIVQLYDAVTLLLVQAQVKIVDLNNIQISVGANMPNNVNVVVFGVPSSPLPVQPGDYSTKAYVDARTPNLPAPVTSGTTIQTFTDVLGQVWIAKNGVNGGNWLLARDVLAARWMRTGGPYTINAGATIIALDTAARDLYGLYATGTSSFTVPVAGLYDLSGQVGVTATATGQWVMLRFYMGASAGPTLQAAATAHASAATTVAAPYAGPHYLNAGDVVQLFSSASAALAGVIGSPNWWIYAAVSYRGTG